MAVYAIGDVQGCFKPLLKLLKKINFDQGRDELWFCGDLVNRGPRSLDVLRLVKNLPLCRVVLGNHDLHLLAVAEGFRSQRKTDTFDDVLAAGDREDLLTWLRSRPLAYYDEQRRLLLVHAGLHPEWSLSEGLRQAREVELLLNSDTTYHQLLSRMYGSEPEPASDQTDRYDRSRWIINAFTRMRYCDPQGRLDFSQVGAPGSQPDGLYPWFQLRPSDGFRIVFGHWSLLGANDYQQFISLDSGCVHGGQLTAVQIDQQPARFVKVKCSN